MPAVYRDTAAIMSIATAAERDASAAAVDVVASGVIPHSKGITRSSASDAYVGLPRPTKAMGHSRQSLALHAALVCQDDVERLSGGATRDNWIAALTRLERSERGRPEKVLAGTSEKPGRQGAGGDREAVTRTTYLVPDPLSTIERARHLRTDVALQENAALILEARAGAADPSAPKLHPTPELSLMMGVGRAVDGFEMMARMPTRTLESFARGGSVEGVDAIRLGSLVNSSLNEPVRDADAAIADGIGAARTHGIGDALLGRGRDRIQMIAPGEERHRVRSLEAELGIEPSGPILPDDRRRPFIGDASLYGDAPGRESPVRGAEKRVAHLLSAGDDAEVRIKAEKEFLDLMSKRDLASAFTHVMPKGPIPDDRAGRDAWTDAALRNELMMAVGGTLPRDALIEASLRERGPVPDMVPKAVPEGVAVDRALAQSADMADNLARVDDRMLKGRFKDVHGIDRMEIPTEPRERADWIMSVGRIDVGRANAAASGRTDVLPGRAAPEVSAAVAAPAQSVERDASVRASMAAQIAASRALQR